jgi:hypothetical protein
MPSRAAVFCGRVVVWSSARFCHLALAAAMQKLKLPGVVINLQERCVDNRP